MLGSDARPTRTSTDLRALRHNLAQLRARLADRTAVALVVKADAYGHGAVEVARTAVECDVTRFVVATVTEGAELREAGITQDIILHTPCTEPELDRALQLELHLVLGSVDAARTLSVWATGYGRIARVHVEVDTGMGRGGLAPDYAIPAIADIAQMESLELVGVMTHFPSADVADDAFTHDQISLFSTIVDGVRAKGVDPGIVHAANSLATVNYPAAQFDMVRAGLLAYGIRPGPGFGADLDLHPVLTFDSEIAHLARHPAGKPLSYGRTYVLPEETVIATVPAGYGDGVPWSASNRGAEVLVRKQRVPVVGQICMDQLLIDVGDVEDVKVGDRVTLIGAQGRRRVTVEDWAAAAGTSPYEIPCRIPPRVPRAYQR